MSITDSDLDSFQRFAKSQLEFIPPDTTLEELAYQWQMSQERDEVNESIREGLADVEAGRYRPVREAIDSIARKYGISNE